MITCFMTVLIKLSLQQSPGLVNISKIRRKIRNEMNTTVFSIGIRSLKKQNLTLLIGLKKQVLLLQFYSYCEFWVSDGT